MSRSNLGRIESRPIRRPISSEPADDIIYRNDHWLTMSAEGWTAGDIAIRFGVSVSTVRRGLREAAGRPPADGPGLARKREVREIAVDPAKIAALGRRLRPGA